MNNQQKGAARYGGHEKCSWLWKQLAQGIGELCFQDFHQGGVFFWKRCCSPSRTLRSEALRL